eukprot:scaffold36414_cov27-Tisochrysis_lutea.AAC.2
MRESIHFAPNERKSAKQQALAVVKALQSSNALPIMRNLMHLRLVLPSDQLDEARAKLRAMDEGAERIQMGDVETHEGSTDDTAAASASAQSVALDCRADPSLYRPIAEMVGTLGGSLHVVALKASGSAAEGGLDAKSRPADSAAARRDSPALPMAGGLVNGNTAAAAVAAMGGAIAGGRGGNMPVAVGRGKGGGKGGSDGKDDPGLAARRAERMFKVNMRSADNGDPVAQLEVGKAYLNGLGVERDPVQARHWLEQAFQQGVQVAKAHLDQVPAD